MWVFPLSGHWAIWIATGGQTLYQLSYLASRFCTAQSFFYARVVASQVILWIFQKFSCNWNKAFLLRDGKTWNLPSADSVSIIIALISSLSSVIQYFLTYSHDKFLLFLQIEYGNHLLSPSQTLWMFPATATITCLIITGFEPWTSRPWAIWVATGGQTLYQLSYSASRVRGQK